jgi:hypothetical protein
MNKVANGQGSRESTTAKRTRLGEKRPKAAGAETESAPAPHLSATGEYETTEGIADSVGRRKSIEAPRERRERSALRFERCSPDDPAATIADLISCGIAGGERDIAYGALNCLISDLEVLGAAIRGNAELPVGFDEEHVAYSVQCMGNRAKMAIELADRIRVANAEPSHRASPNTDARSRMDDAAHRLSDALSEFRAEAFRCAISSLSDPYAGRAIDGVDAQYAAIDEVLATFVGFVRASMVTPPAAAPRGGV